MTERKYRDTNQFISEMRIINPNVEVMGEFVDLNTKIRCRCLTCGFDQWYPTPGNLLQGHGCIKCAGHMPYTDETYRMKLKSIHPQIEVLGEYNGSGKNIAVKCLKCGNEWAPKAGALLRQKGCKVCRGLGIQNQEQYVTRLRECNENIEVLGHFISLYEPIKCLCKVCNNEWEEKRPYELLRGHGCPNCDRSSSSYVEQFILRAFIKVFGEENVKSRDRKVIGKELDIYIPSVKFAIEPGHWYYHKSKQERDIQKINDCRKKGINLLCVYYGCNEKIETDCPEMLIYEENIASYGNRGKLQGLVKYLLEQVGIEKQFTQEEWQDINKSAYFYSRRMNTEKFREYIASINADIDILGEYQKADVPIEVQCKICGRIWQTKPEILSAGHGCLTCKLRENGEKSRLSDNEFKERISQINPNIIIMGDYTKSEDTIKIKCKLCGNIWEPIANDILRGHGCQKCGHKNAGKKRRLSHQEFVDRVALTAPNLKIVSEYKTKRDDIDWECLQCGEKSTSKASDLLDGCGCKKCSIKKFADRIRLTQAEFEKRVYEKGKDIVILGVYKGAHEEIECKCNACGEIWYPEANSLMKGSRHGCSKNRKNRKRKYTDEQIKYALSILHNPFTFAQVTAQTGISKKTLQREMERIKND